jgi:hypothetical protein
MWTEFEHLDVYLEKALDTVDRDFLNRGSKKVGQWDDTYGQTEIY